VSCRVVSCRVVSCRVVPYPRLLRKMASSWARCPASSAYSCGRSVEGGSGGTSAPGLVCWSRRCSCWNSENRRLTVRAGQGRVCVCVVQKTDRPTYLPPSLSTSTLSDTLVYPTCPLLVLRRLVCLSVCLCVCLSVARRPHSVVVVVVVVAAAGSESD
jgi:hypothetical protein